MPEIQGARHKIDPGGHVAPQAFQLEPSREISDFEMAEIWMQSDFGMRGSDLIAPTINQTQFIDRQSIAQPRVKRVPEFESLIVPFAFPLVIHIPPTFPLI